jgi:hypothetical protein
MRRHRDRGVRESCRHLVMVVSLLGCQRTPATSADAETGMDGPPVSADAGLEDAVPGSCPAEGTACAMRASCSVGDRTDVGCRALSWCENGSWQRASLYAKCGTAMGSPCPTPSAVDGASCTVAGQLCSYPIHTCTCATGCESGADAGACRGPLLWRCGGEGQPPGCEPQAPHLGTPCVQDAVICSYGSYCVQYRVVCQGHVWRLAGPLELGGCQ